MTDPVTRLARHREAMTLALAEGLSLQAATDRLAHERWIAAHGKLMRRQCGTAAPASGGDSDRREAPEQWWQRL